MHFNSLSTHEWAALFQFSHARIRQLRKGSLSSAHQLVQSSVTQLFPPTSGFQTMANLIINSSNRLSHLHWSTCFISSMKARPKSPFSEPCSLWRSSCYISSRRLSHSAEPPASSSHTPAGEVSDDDSLLVYTGSMSPMVKRLKLVSLTTSTVGVSMQPFIYRSLVQPGSSAGVSIAVGAAAVTTTLVILSPLLLNLLTKRYVMHLYFNEKSQTFTLISLNFFNRKKSRTFRADDVQVPLSTGPFTTFLVNGQPYFVDGLAFSDINIYNHLMGYDKLDEKIKRMTEKTSNHGESR